MKLPAPLLLGTMPLPAPKNTLSPYTTGVVVDWAATLLLFRSDRAPVEASTAAEAM